MGCTYCGAALPVNSNVCIYCKSVNDPVSDLHRRSYEGDDYTRVCPRCDVKLHPIDLNVNGAFFVDRCKQCQGIFFDKGELRSLIFNPSAEPEHESVLGKILAAQPDFKKEQPSGYIKCPICKNLMNRENYGRNSGIIADVCAGHGFWLDGGELIALLGWAKEQQPKDRSFSVRVENSENRATGESVKKKLIEIESKAFSKDEIDDLLADGLARLFADWL